MRLVRGGEQALGDELSISCERLSQVGDIFIRTMRTTSSPKSATSLHTENSLRIVRVLTPPLVMLTVVVRRLVSHGDGRSEQKMIDFPSRIRV